MPEQMSKHLDLNVLHFGGDKRVPDIYGQIILLFIFI